MTVRQKNEQGWGLFFCTITCFKWKPLFEITNFYDQLYKWLNILAKKDIQTIGFVFMPNHFHCLIFLPDKSHSINSILGTGKRFMAYEIVNRLTSLGHSDLLKELSAGVTDSDRKKKQLHRVFQPSFDIKQCFSEKFVWQKLAYMHLNPVRGKWMLSNDYRTYFHSSAGFYEMGCQHSKINLTHCYDAGIDEQVKQK